MKKRRKILIAVLIALILMMVAGVLTFVIRNQTSLKESNQSSGAETSTNDGDKNISGTNKIETGEVTNEMIEQTNSEPEPYDYSTLENEDTSSELFNDYYGQATEILKSMTLEEKIGQMFLARYPDEDANDEIKGYNPGGYILFAKDFKNETVKSITAKLTENQSNSKIKLLLGVDEEGGDVVRVSSYKKFRSSKFQSPQKLDEEGGLDKIIEDSHEKTSLLKSLGLNSNLVPVVDVPTDSSSFIYSRAYGKSAEETAIYSQSVIKAMNEDKIISTMKHFPGYGDNEDTHTGVAVDEREYSQFENADFLPFKSGIEEGCPTILVNHNIVKCMDEAMPASLSEKVNKILRDELKFSGLVMTDDLAMDAVKSYVDNGEAAVQAVLAGNDMIISSDFIKQKNEVLEATKNGKIPQDTINKAVRRILACKLAYGII